MQYKHEGVEIDLSILEFQHIQWTVETISENRIIVHLVVWIRQAIEFDSVKSCHTIEKSAEFPYMVHIARNAEKHLIRTTYGLQYSSG